MSILVAILGLALLISSTSGPLLGALAVGMRPRGFSLGFGPPSQRCGVTTRLRVPGDPARGLREDPRDDAATGRRDVDAFFAVPSATAELLGPAERLKRCRVGRGLGAGARRAGRLEAAAVESGSSKSRIDRGDEDVSDSLSKDAYWRQAIWRRIVAIVAGPATNLAFAVVIFAVVLMSAWWQSATRRWTSLRGRAGAGIGLQPGDRIVEINGTPMTPDKITERISGSEGGRLLSSSCATAKQTLGPVRAERTRASTGSASVSRRRSLRARPGQSRQSCCWRRVTGEIGKSLAASSTRRGASRSPARSASSRSPRRRPARDGSTYLAVLAFISLSLGLLNLLPLLPLDGGHIVFAIAEKVRGNAIRAGDLRARLGRRASPSCYSFSL